MTPPRPTETDESRPEARATARWFQWAHDSIIELNHQYGPGVLTNNTTRGIFQRMQGRARANVGDNAKTCHLPTLDPALFYFGYWYDAFNELHLWNANQVDFNGVPHVQFFNPFVVNEYPTEARGIYDATLSDCLGVVGTPAIGQVSGPWDYPITGPSGLLKLGVGQYVLIEIIKPRRNCAFLYGTLPYLPPLNATGDQVLPTIVNPNGSLYYAGDIIDPFDPREKPRPVNPGPLPF